MWLGYIFERSSLSWWLLPPAFSAGNFFFSSPYNGRLSQPVLLGWCIVLGPLFSNVFVLWKLPIVDLLPTQFNKKLDRIVFRTQQPMQQVLWWSSGNSLLLINAYFLFWWLLSWSPIFWSCLPQFGLLLDVPRFLTFKLRLSFDLEKKILWRGFSHQVFTGDNFFHCTKWNKISMCYVRLPDF